MKLSEAYIQKYIHNLGKFKDDPIEVLSKGFLPDYTRIVQLETIQKYGTNLQAHSAKVELNKLKNDHGL